MIYGAREYQVQLFHIAPELYRYAQSLNDIDNNELAQTGFATLRPTFSNIAGGIGVMGSYNVSYSQWTEWPKTK